MKTRTTLSLDPDILTKLAEVGNASLYVSRVLRERFDAIRASERALALGGWRSQDVFAALDALQAIDLERASAAMLASELESAAVERRVPTIDLGVWRERIESVRNDPEVSRALAIVVAELRLGNEECKRRVSRMLGKFRHVAGVTFAGVDMEVQLVDQSGKRIAGPFLARRSDRIDLGLEPVTTPILAGTDPPVTDFRLVVGRHVVWTLDRSKSLGPLPWIELAPV